MRPSGPGLKYERIVLASTRRFPSTTMEPTVCAYATPVGTTAGAAPNTTPARTKQATPSPRMIRTPSPIRPRALLSPIGRLVQSRPVAPSEPSPFQPLCKASRPTFSPLKPKRCSRATTLLQCLTAYWILRDEPTSYVTTDVIVGRKDHQH